jgi:hypothetical protein
MGCWGVTHWRDHSLPSLYAWQCRGRRWAWSTVSQFCVTGQEKAGEAGVKRQYMGCAGRVANGISTVHLSYVRARTGHALIGARQRIPQEHTEDPVKSLVMGLSY